MEDRQTVLSLDKFGTWVRDSVAAFSERDVQSTGFFDMCPPEIANEIVMRLPVPCMAKLAACSVGCMKLVDNTINGSGIRRCVVVLDRTASMCDKSNMNVAWSCLENISAMQCAHRKIPTSVYTFDDAGSLHHIENYDSMESVKENSHTLMNYEVCNCKTTCLVRVILNVRAQFRDPETVVVVVTDGEDNDRNIDAAMNERIPGDIEGKSINDWILDIQRTATAKRKRAQKQSVHWAMLALSASIVQHSISHIDVLGIPPPLFVTINNDQLAAQLSSAGDDSRVISLSSRSGDPTKVFEAWKTVNAPASRRRSIARILNPDVMSSVNWTDEQRRNRRALANKFPTSTSASQRLKMIHVWMGTIIRDLLNRPYDYAALSPQNKRRVDIFTEIVPDRKFMQNRFLLASRLEIVSLFNDELPDVDTKLGEIMQDPVAHEYGVSLAVERVIKDVMKCPHMRSHISDPSFVCLVQNFVRVHSGELIDFIKSIAGPKGPKIQYPYPCVYALLGRKDALHFRQNGMQVLE